MLTLQLVGELPENSVYMAGAQRLQPHLSPGKAELPLPEGTLLPVAVTIKAIGFQPLTVTVAHLAGLEEPRPVSPERSKGTLVLSRHGPSDYGAVSVQMYQTLEKEQGFVPLNRFSYSRGFTGAEREQIRWELPTGSYDVRLLGVNRQINTRNYQRVTIEEGGEQPCLMPPSFLGRFAGELAGTGSAAPPSTTSVQLRFTENLTEGEMVEQARTSLEGLRVNSEGVLTATLRCSSGHETPAYDQTLTARLSGDGSELNVKFVEVFTDDVHARAAVKRPAYAETEWQRSGTLHRQSGGGY